VLRSLLAQRREASQVALPNAPQDELPADKCAEWAAQPPRELQLLFPHELGGVAVDAAQGEHAATRDDPDVLDVMRILSVRRIGPTLVTHKNAVPTPRR
jgi:hypothetical protein